MSRKVQGSRFRTVGGGFWNYHEVIAEHGFTLTDLIKPECWSHVARQLRAKDEIRVHFEDNSFRATLVVLDATETSASVVITSHTKLDEQGAKATEEEVALSADAYLLEYTPATSWRAVRKSDKVAVVEGYKDRRACEYALNEYIERMLQSHAA